jgi:hypothetical protein
MSTPYLRPQLEYLGHTDITKKVVSERNDRVIETLVNVPAGTAAALREALASYPDGNATYANGPDEYFDRVLTWRDGLTEAVRNLYEWDGWRLNDMAAFSYIEKISGERAECGGETDDHDHVAIILARNGVNLPQGVSVRDLDGLGWA